MLKKILRRSLRWGLTPLAAFFFAAAALLARYTAKRPIDIGLGPEPLINNVFHKRSLEKAGYSAETFVSNVYYITKNFDVIAERQNLLISSCRLAFMALFRYKCLYIYFNGGPLAWTPLRQIEPYIYKIAGIRTLVMPYGSDVQDMSLCPNLAFKQAMNLDYPSLTAGRDKIAENIARWTRHADHIISGCDWVYYTPRWDSLCLAHFSIDTDAVRPPDARYPVNEESIVVLHAPNHRNLKGSRYFIRAVEELRAEGYPVELQLVQNMPNSELQERIKGADIIADQLIVGWYAMFAIEGMSAGKPVLCFLRNELIELFESANLVVPGEIPLVNCTWRTVKAELRRLLDDRTLIAAVGKASREYAVKHHSLAAVGRLFAAANKNMGLAPVAELSKTDA
ncbi:hypothetical protein LJC15_00315 [Desulfovibrio sp. OttesenSCG-928-G11]|nr:hypothetical protein [Desulfovibrio sp. OttesenSCG-928-G11]